MRDFSLYHEDIRREINLQAIHFNIILNRIDESYSLVIDKNELSPKLEGDLEKTKKGSIFNIKSGKGLKDLDRDCRRWRNWVKRICFSERLQQQLR